MLGTADLRERDRGVARERWDLGKERVLLNVQPVSKWGTIFYRDEKGEEGWQSVFLRMTGGTARENCLTGSQGF